MTFHPTSKAYGLYALPEYIKASQLCSVLGISRSSLFNAARQGLFPTPIRIGIRSYRWVKQDLLTYFGESSTWRVAHD